MKFNWLIFILFPCSLFANPLKQLLNTSLEGVSWNSETHSHDYKNSELKDKISFVFRGFLETPEFEIWQKELSDEERQALLKDDSDDRTDLFDLLSVELKLQIEKFWEKNFSKKYKMAHATLWSIAKSRLAASLGSKEDRVGFRLARHLRPDSRDLVLVCANGPDAKVHRITEHRDQVFGGILFSEHIKPGSNFEFECKRKKFRLSYKPHSPDLNIQVAKNYDFEPAYRQEELFILGAVGGTETLSKRRLEVLEFALENFYGWRAVSRANVQLRQSLEENLPRADIFISLIDVQNGNQFQFSKKFQNATSLLLEKKLRNPLNAEKRLNVLFRLLLPPRPDFPSVGDSGVALTAEELIRSLRSKPNLPVIMDLSCFSEFNLTNWANVLISSRDPKEKINFPPILTSKSGRKGENVFQLFLQLDLAMQVANALARDADKSEVDSLLRSGTLLQNFIEFLNDPFQMFRDKKQNLAGFHLAPVPEDIQNWSAFENLEAVGPGGTIQIYPPNLNRAELP